MLCEWGCVQAPARMNIGTGSACTRNQGPCALNVAFILPPCAHADCLAHENPISLPASVIARCS